MKTMLLVAVSSQLCDFKVSEEKQSWYRAIRACPEKYKGSKLALSFNSTDNAYWIRGKKKKVWKKKYCE